MSNRSLFLMTGLVVLCIAILLVLNALPLILSWNWTWNSPKEKYLKYNEVRGMAVEYKKKLFTLSFDQQNEVIGHFNKSLPIANTSAADQISKLEISKIVVYRFGLPDLTIIPIEYSSNNLIFSSPDWNRDGLMRDTSGGGLKNILANTYDP
jgi:hypothetical protein